MRLTSEKSNITNILYTSIPSYVTSDHKPVVCLLLPPPPTVTSSPETRAPPMLQLLSLYTPTPDPHATLKRYTGRTLDRIIGSIWWLLTAVGAGSATVSYYIIIFPVACHVQAKLKNTLVTLLQFCTLSSGDDAWYFMLFRKLLMIHRHFLVIVIHWFSLVYKFFDATDGFVELLPHVHRTTVQR
ncbi:hypothetical protein EDB19DRAFT_1318518 [Suillus lakei]|nr:hypothetical protein EDB19DRAFT_1318518 [Suillus lakei]